VPNFTDLLHPNASGFSMSSGHALWRNVWVTALGFAVYGFTAGVWRSPMMGGYVAVKMPLLIALTLGFNSLLNGLLGTLLGSRLGVLGSLNALLGAFAISALILGSLAPVLLFFIANAPAPDSASAGATHALLLLAHTSLIAVAGLAGVLRLSRLLVAHAVSQGAARVTLAAWIAGNAFLGSQFAWILRPFFGSPTLEVAFLRPDPMRGSFYETIWKTSLQMIRGPESLILPAILLLCLLIVWSMHHNYQINQTNKRP
jgi:hypothetical protein